MASISRYENSISRRTTQSFRIGLKTHSCSSLGISQVSSLTWEGIVIGVNINLTSSIYFPHLGTKDGAVQGPSTGRPEVAGYLDPRYFS